MKRFLLLTIILFSCFSYADEQFDRLLKAANKGNPKAQHSVALRYQLGIKVASDDNLAIHWFRQAASQGNGDSIRDLGVMYCAQGTGVDMNMEVCYAMLSLAATKDTSGLSKTILDRHSRRMSELQISAGIELAEEMSKPNNLLVALDAHLEKAKKETADSQ